MNYVQESLFGFFSDNDKEREDFEGIIMENIKEYKYMLSLANFYISSNNPKINALCAIVFNQCIKYHIDVVNDDFDEIMNTIQKLLLHSKQQIEFSFLYESFMLILIQNEVKIEAFFDDFLVATNQNYDMVFYCISFFIDLAPFPLYSQYFCFIYDICEQYMAEDDERIEKALILIEYQINNLRLSSFQKEMLYSLVMILFGENKRINGKMIDILKSISFDGYSWNVLASLRHHCQGYDLEVETGLLFISSCVICSDSVYISDLVFYLKNFLGLLFENECKDDEVVENMIDTIINIAKYDPIIFVNEYQNINDHLISLIENNYDLILYEKMLEFYSVFITTCSEEKQIEVLTGIVNIYTLYINSSDNEQDVIAFLYCIENCFGNISIDNIFKVANELSKCTDYDQSTYTYMYLLLYKILAKNKYDIEYQPVIDFLLNSDGLVYQYAMKTTKAIIKFKGNKDDIFFEQIITIVMNKSPQYMADLVLSFVDNELLLSQYLPFLLNRNEETIIDCTECVFEVLSRIVDKYQSKYSSIIIHFYLNIPDFVVNCSYNPAFCDFIAFLNTTINLNILTNELCLSLIHLLEAVMDRGFSYSSHSLYTYALILRTFPDFQTEYLPRIICYIGKFIESRIPYCVAHSCEVISIISSIAPESNFSEYMTIVSNLISSNYYMDESLIKNYFECLLSLEVSQQFVRNCDNEIIYSFLNISTIFDTFLNDKNVTGPITEIVLKLFTLVPEKLIGIISITSDIWAIDLIQSLSENIFMNETSVFMILSFIVNICNHQIISDVCIIDVIECLPMIIGYGLNFEFSRKISLECIQRFGLESIFGNIR